MDLLFDVFIPRAAATLLLGAAISPLTCQLRGFLVDAWYVFHALHIRVIRRQLGYFS